MSRVVRRPTGEKRVSPPPPERQTDEPDNTDRQDQVLTEAKSRTMTAERSGVSPALLNSRCFCYAAEGKSAC